MELSTLLDLDAATERLTNASLSDEAARAKAMLLARSAQALIDDGATRTASAHACYVPGRIEVLGKHTDYAGGRSLVAAPERGFCAVVVEHEEPLVRVSRSAEGDAAEFPLTGDLAPQVGSWLNYPMTMARRLVRNFSPPLRGVRFAFQSDLPVAAGMSSSSAMMIATFLAIDAVNHLCKREEYRREIASREDLAGFLATVENGQSFGSLTGDKGVGTFGGSEDHTAILCGRPKAAVQYSYCPVRFERTVRFPDDHALLIASSGVVAEKTGAAMKKYNRTSRLAAAAVETWNTVTGRSDPHLAAAVASAPDAAEQLLSTLRTSHPQEFTAADLVDRAEHFVRESEEILPAVAANLSGEAVKDFGTLVDRSQELGERLLKNQVPETVLLARSARELGAAAASAFGAGFGGSVWALAKADEASSLCERWAAHYAERFPQWAKTAEFFTTRPGPAALRLGETPLS